MTPSLARMVLSLCRENSGPGKVEIAALLPIKWFSIPQCWRFETTQRGRKREHYQWNMDIVGMPTVNCEAELLAGMVHFFESIGITSKDVGIKINSRKVLGCVLEDSGVPKEHFEKVCVLVDKLDKIGGEEVVKMLVNDLSLPQATAESIVEATTERNWEALAKYSKEGVDDLRQLFALAEGYGYSDWLIFDASVVRGLAYYTGIVFEAFDRKGELRAIAGGGRYDRLLTLYGAPSPIPCVGFGFGDCVIKELLEERGLMPKFDHTVEYVVLPHNDAMMPNALRVARELRAGGKSVDVAPEAFSRVQKGFKYADKVGAKRIAFVAPQEWENKCVRIKDLRSGDGGHGEASRTQVDVPVDDLKNVDKYFPSP